MLLISICGFSAQAFECPVSTVSADTAVKDWEVTAKYAWYGSEDLAAWIPKHGHWNGMGLQQNYRNKFWWWQKDFDTRKGGKPALTVSANRLDAYAEPVFIDDATAGYNVTLNAILVFMEFPALGCWEVIGDYQGQQLKIILKVGIEADSDDNW